MNDAIKMQLSAFVDGELSDAEASLFIRRLSRDPELRALAEDYQSMGRVMRAEQSVPGVDQLLNRIHVELGDDAGLPAEQAPVAEASGRRYGPMVGMAAAAAVAVLAIFSVGQFNAVPEASTAESYTVPEAADEIYFERHGQTASSFGTRVVTYQLQSENLGADSADDDVADTAEDTEKTPAAE